MTPTVEYVKKKLRELKPADYNPREITTEALAGLRKSVTTFGLVQPIVWNKRTGNIVGGHKRIEALYAEGWTDDSDIDVAVVDLTDAGEKRLNVTLNNPNIGGQFTDTLTGILDELRSEDATLFAELRLDLLLPQVPGGGMRENNDDEQFDRTFEVIVQCKSESAQQELYQRLEAEGYACRVLTL